MDSLTGPCLLNIIHLFTGWKKLLCVLKLLKAEIHSFPTMYNTWGVHIGKMVRINDFLQKILLWLQRKAGGGQVDRALFAKHYPPLQTVKREIMFCPVKTSEQNFFRYTKVTSKLPPVNKNVKCYHPLCLFVTILFEQGLNSSDGSQPC